MIDGWGARLRYHWRKITGAALVRHEGVLVPVDRGAMSRRVVRTLYRGHWENEEIAAARRLLREEDRVLEIGAGIGVVSVVCAKIVGDARLLAFEANHATAALARRTLEANGVAPRMVAAAVTLGDDHQFFRGEEIWAGRLLPSSGFAETAPDQPPSVDFRAVMRDFRPTVLVMDVEGYETRLLGEGPLDGVRAILVETHPLFAAGSALDAMRRRLRNLDFAAEAPPDGGVETYVREPR